jgi:hypothetical protein
MNDCSICIHPKRLEIDRELVKGRPVAALARSFAVSSDSLYRHAQNHVSRQLAQAYEKQQLVEGSELLDTINRIIARAEDIFNRSYEAKHDVTALKALDSQRNTIDLLAKISYQLHQAKLAELQLLKEKSGDTFEQAEQEYRRNISVLSDEELPVYERFINKIFHQNADKIISNGRVLVKNCDDKRTDIDYTDNGN